MKQKIFSILNSLSNIPLCLPSDIYERHKYIASFIPKDSTVLDIGGSLSRLSSFVDVKELTTADIKPPADIVYDGRHIPVKDSSYDVVTSIDVLEHVPKEQREDFITELVRISRLKVVISAPFGSTLHIDYEKEALKKYKERGIPVPYLEEHVERGLPEPQELKTFVRTYKGELFYSGDIRLTKILFYIHTYESKNTFLNTLLFMVKLTFNFIVNLIGYPLIINKREAETVNRFYLVIDKR